MDLWLHILTLGILLAAITPLCLSVFHYVTRPSRSRRHVRVFTNAWLNPVGIQVVGQKTILIALLTFIWLTRFFGDWQGRQVIAFVLFLMLVAAFWSFYVIQRSVQRPSEEADREQAEQAWRDRNSGA